MKIRIIDFVGNPGGGLRFVVELLKAMKALDPDIEIEFVSHGQALHRYLDIFNYSNLDLEVVELNSSWSSGIRQIIPRKWFPGKKFLKEIITPFIQWHYHVPPDLAEDCDVLWLPWLHWHRVPLSISKKVVSSFHDAIVLQFETGLAKSRVDNERETVREWLLSEATIVTSSRATVNRLVDLFDISVRRFSVIPLSGEHLRRENNVPAHFDFSGLPADYLFYPANIFPHKDHETLFKAIAKAGNIFPLVLTGEGTELRNSDRGRMLTNLAISLGLVDNQCLYPMGYLPNDLYDSLLDHASALVMCSLAEGGGSFPVWEAMLRGKPVICSDIPVMREQLERTGGDILWFSPGDYDELADKLTYLHAHYDDLLARAITQSKNLKKRSWKKVAEEYLEIFAQVSQR